MNITAYSVIIFFDTCLIREIKNAYFEDLHGNLVEIKFVTRHEKPGLCTQNTPIHIMVCISFTVHDFRNL